MYVVKHEGTVLSHCNPPDAPLARVMEWLKSHFRGRREFVSSFMFAGEGTMVVIGPQGANVVLTVEEA